jgi:radical SAM protein with 4Fe4S-binding SPASM domain
MFEELRLEVNKPCNFACIHCYTEKRGPKATPSDTFVTIIRESAKRGATALSLTGGEPLLAPQRCLELIREGARAGMRVRLNTNGALITRDMAGALFAAGLEEAQISLNAASPEAFDSFVRRSGAFRKVIEGIEAAVAVGLQVTIRYSLMRENAPQLLPTYELSTHLGASRFKVRRIVEVNNISDPLDSVQEDNLRETVQSFLERAATGPMAVEVALGGLQVRLPAKSRILAQPCKCGAHAVFVGSDGGVFPCPFLRETEAFKLGNIKERNLFEIIDTSPELAFFIGEREDQGCGNVCANGCRASEVSEAIRA